MINYTCNRTYVTLHIYTNAGDVAATYFRSVHTHRLSSRSIAKSYGLPAKPGITTTRISTPEIREGFKICFI